LFEEQQTPMLDKVLTDAAHICAMISSFGEILDRIRVTRALTQKQLAKHLYRSEAEISRLLNNQMPRKLQVTDVHQLAQQLDCSRVELAELMEAFVCFLLTDHEVIDLDVF
jgi:transcriptional regulator with XRE-family HTH domain